MSAPFAPLALADEDVLHRARLLNTEERAFKRVAKRLLATDSVFTSLKNDTDRSSENEAEDAALDGDGELESASQRRIEEYTKLREDIMMDFAAFEANLVRTQLLLNSNAKERERYAAEKVQIQETAHQVRENTGELRMKLAEAQQTLEQRRGWDRLAERITNNRMLKTREEQQANIEKLNNEIAELEQESRDYAETWAERRQQFGRIVDEGMQMLRLIRDEKEEVERREGMEGQEEGDETDGGRGAVASNVGTPRPDGGATPLHPGVEGEQNDGMLHPLAKSPLRGSPAPGSENLDKSTPHDSDADMADEGEVEDDDRQEEDEGEEVQHSDDDGEEEEEEEEIDDDSNKRRTRSMRNMNTT